MANYLLKSIGMEYRMLMSAKYQYMIKQKDVGEHMKLVAMSINLESHMELNIQLT